MKTKLIILLFLLMSLSINAQIKYDAKKPSLTVKQSTTTLKLPLLNATSLDRFSYGKIENKIKQLSPKKIVTIAASGYATSSKALNVFLNTNNLRNEYGGLYFKGTFDNSNIKIESKYNDVLGIYFRAKRNKTYRVKLLFDVKFDTNKCKKPMLAINMGSASQALGIKKGQNALDFLVRSEVEGKISFFPLNKLALKCEGQHYRMNNLEFFFKSVKIQEEQD